jgi:uncharacterized membrane protein YphA (DoxX/SURF4 family)
MRHPAARMQPEETPESPVAIAEPPAAPTPKKKKAKEPEPPSGLFGSAVLVARDVLGEQELKELRAKVIKEHSGVIANFVATSDTAFGNAVLKKMFEVADKDGNGTLDPDELKEALEALGFVATSDKDVAKIVKKMDKDKNGMVDFEEFRLGAEPVLKQQLTLLAKENGHDLGFLVDLKYKAEPIVKKDGEWVGEWKLSDDFQKTATEVVFLLMRVVAAAVMFHHGQEILLDPAVFAKYTIDKKFAFLPGDHVAWSSLVGSIELFAPILVGLGVFSRVASLSLAAVMTQAIFYSNLANKGWEGFPFFELGGLSSTMKYKVYSFHNYGFETPALYLGIFLLVAAAGPGKFSIAQLLGWNDDKSFSGKLKQ